MITRVVVNKANGRFAGANHLRRSFGTRWATRAKPSTLMQLMRYESIQITTKFYLELDAANVADELCMANNQEGPVLAPPWRRRTGVMADRRLARRIRPVQ